MKFMRDKESDRGQHQEVIEVLQEEQKKMAQSGTKTRRGGPVAAKKSEAPTWATPPAFIFYPTPEEMGEMILNAAHVVT